MHHIYRFFCLLLFLAMPFISYATENVLKHFSLDIPEGYTVTEDGISYEITDSEKKEALIFSQLPYAAKTLLAYSENLAKQWNADTPVKVDENTYSFNFENVEYGACTAYVKLIGKRKYFFLLAGEDKTNLEAILQSLKAVN